MLFRSKKFRVTVTKSDVETGAPQGDGSLAGAVYGLYKGDTLIDSFTTDENGQFTTGYYVCDSDWTIREKMCIRDSARTALNSPCSAKSSCRESVPSFSTCIRSTLLSLSLIHI